MSEQTVVASITIDEEIIRAQVDKRVVEFLENYLTRNWYTRKDIKFKTGMKSDDWIRDNVDNHPYVIKNGLKFTTNDSVNSEPRYVRGIDAFLDKFGLIKNKEEMK